MLRLIPFLALVLSSVAFAAPKYVETTKRLAQDHSYFQETKTSDFWKLIPYYLPQHNPKACSVASVAAVLNALRADVVLTSSDELYTSESILKLSPAFAKAVSKSGKGMDLDSLQKNLSDVLEKMFPGKYTVQTQRFHLGDSKANRKKLIELLTKNEATSSDFVIANFLQSVLTGDPEGVGHISPVGAFDSRRERVLVLDTDRQYYEPYWVSVDQFMAALNAEDGTAKRARGLVYITLK